MESKETSSDAEVYIKDAQARYTYHLIRGKVSPSFLKSFKLLCVSLLEKGPNYRQ